MTFTKFPLQKETCTIWKGLIKVTFDLNSPLLILYGPISSMFGVHLHLLEYNLKQNIKKLNIT